MKFSERSKWRQFTIEDDSGRQLYFNDGESEYFSPLFEHLSDNKIDDLITLVKELKEEEDSHKMKCLYCWEYKCDCTREDVESMS